MSLATRHDLTRSEIVDRFRQRIQAERRIRLSRDELGQLALHFLERLIQLQQQGQDSEAAIAALAAAEIALLEEGYPQQSISSQYLSTYRKLIGDAIASGQLLLTEQNSYLKPWQKLDGSDAGLSREHYALKHLKYDLATYQTLRQSTTANNNKRQDNLQVIPLQRYLDQVMQLLQQDDERLLAIAIAALTGRRHTEVISKGVFEQTPYPYALHFSGQQKKAESLSFDILTLVPAQTVLAAIERFRSLAAIAPLVAASAGHDDPRIDAFNTRVNRQVRKYFQETGIVPVPDGFKSVSIHRLRGIYGAIAIHYFCPEWKHEHRFLQHYLGHVVEGTITPNSRATDHYFHYRLAKADGSLITVRGLKIPANGLPPLPEAADNRSMEVQAMTATGQEKTATAIAAKKAAQLAQARGLADVDADTLESWKRQRGINNRFWSLRDRYGISFDFKTSTWLDLWQGATTQAAKTAAPSPTSSTASTASSRPEADRHQRQPQPPSTRQSNQPSAQESPLTQADLASLQRWAAQQGLSPASPAEALRTLLNQAQPAPPPEPPGAETLAAIAHQASTMAWLTQEVETLRTENSQLKTQLQQASTDSAQVQRLTQQLTTLQQEKAQLQQQLQQFEAIRQALLGGIDPVSPPVVVTSTPPLPASPPPATRTGRGRKAGSAKERAKAIFETIALWNQQHPEAAWAVNASLLEREFGINRKAAKDFEAERQPEIDRLHQLAAIENPSTHNRGKDVEVLKAFVQKHLEPE
ncbi:protelomerase family protein [Almyronema epifaneia]|uniref:Protelomerase family protein n=1 Tax=Almyronema epifaneia S1 TaxID=2991925 RepID=A0ABW6IJ12_9CYAN